MNSSETIKEELASLNSSLSPVKKPVFSVPDGYFENFAASVLLRIGENKTVESDVELSSQSPLRGISRQMPYSVPENYFTSLSNEIPVLIGDDPLPSILQEAGKRNAYQVPQGYFENLSAAVLEKVTVPAPAKLVSMGGTKWMRLAAAAVIIGVVALGSFFYFSKDDQPGAVTGSWVATELKDVSDQALEEFVQTADVTSNRSTVGTARSSAEVRRLFKDVSDRELDDFLAAVPTDDEELILIN